LNDHEPSAEVAGSGIDARRRVALAVILSGIFVTIMDSSIVNVAIPRTTSFGVGQMLIGVCCPYLGGILGVRRVLLLGIVVFFTSSLLAPVSPNLPAFLAMQFLSGWVLEPSFPSQWGSSPEVCRRGSSFMVSRSTR